LILPVTKSIRALSNHYSTNSPILHDSTSSIALFSVEISDRHSEPLDSAWARRSLGKKHQLNHEGHKEFEQTLILFVLFVV
jgi:hypothetical protein